MATIKCESFTFAACEPGKNNWHNKGRNTLEAAMALKSQEESKGMKCTTPKLVVIEHEVPDKP